MYSKDVYSLIQLNSLIKIRITFRRLLGIDWLTLPSAIEGYLKKYSIKK